MATPSPLPLKGQLLLVDDEPFVLSYLTRTLGSAGHAVTTATDGNVALAAVREKQFDLVVSDLTMPGMDGLELLRQVKKLHPDLPLIFLTGSPDLTSAIRAVELGAFRYLTKPLRDDAIHEAVQLGLHIHDTARLMRRA